MQTFSSAKRTWSASTSADECTATDLMPSSRHARITRNAISPRLAMRTFLYTRRGSGHADELLAVLDVLAVLDEDLGDLAVGLGLDLVHELHGLDDADDLALAHGRAHVDEGGGLGRRRAVEGAHERRRVERASLARPGALEGR